MIFEGDRLIPVVGKDRKKPITITLEPSKSPRHINIKNPGQAEAAKGIYEIVEDTLKISYAEPGKERPENWESKAGSRIFVMTLKRVDKK